MSGENVEEIIALAYEYLEHSNFGDALELGKQILVIDPENTKGLEIMGYVLMEMNCLEDAKYCLQQSSKDKTYESHVSYLYLGQLTNGEESENYTLQAIEYMKKNSVSVNEEKILFKPTALDISNAYISLCELYLTDLSDKENADQKCVSYINQAIEADETNPAAWQTLASLNLNKNEIDSAKENIKKSLSFWLPDALKMISDDDDSFTDSFDSCDFSFEMRTKCAEILLELELLNEAKSVLETILAENEEHFNAHYIMALVLEMLLDQTIDEAQVRELKALIEDHADMAINLADKDLESAAVARMTELIEKIGVGHHDYDVPSDYSGSDLDMNQ